MSKKHILPRLVIYGIILFSLGLTLYAFTLDYFEPDQNTQASLLFSALGFCATLYAPIAAFILYDSWKSQTKFNRVTHNMIELQKILHDYVSGLKSLRSRIIFPYARSKFDTEEDYTDNLKKLFDKKICEINDVRKIEYEAFKTLNILKTDSYRHHSHLNQKFTALESIISELRHEVNHFSESYFLFIHSYYQPEETLKKYLKSDDYKSLTYQISSIRETNNLVKMRIKNSLNDLLNEFDEQTVSIRVHAYVDRIDQASQDLLRTYESLA